MKHAWQIDETCLPTVELPSPVNFAVLSIVA